jgi:putrescine aminotransferase
MAYAEKWLGIIQQKTVSEAEGKWIIEESTNNFSEHFNKGWLEYRKSVTEAGDWAVTEWTGSGAVFQDVLGRTYIDCLGGYGMMDLGWGHPEVVAAVKAQLERTPMPSQELIDPLRGVLARLLAMILPGDIKYSFFCASGTEANEGAIKLAKMYTKRSGFITAVKAFHGKTMGSLSMMGKSDYRVPPGQLYGGPVYHVPFGDAGAVEKQLDICDKVGVDIAAVILEPIQGEAGAIVPPDDFWPRVREVTRHYGVLLIADEVQTGLGRRSLGGKAGYHHIGQVTGRRGDAHRSFLFDRGDLAGDDGSQSVYSYHHNRWWGAGVFGCYCGVECNPARAAVGAGGG